MNGLDTANPFRLQVNRCAYKEGPAVRTTEHAGIGFGLYLDSMGDLATVENAHHLGAPTQRSNPDGTLRIKTDSVRTSPLKIKSLKTPFIELSPDAALREGAVRLNVKGSETNGKCFCEDKSGSCNGP